MAWFWKLCAVDEQVRGGVKISVVVSLLFRSTGQLNREVRRVDGLNERHSLIL